MENLKDQLRKASEVLGPEAPDIFAKSMPANDTKLGEAEAAPQDLSPEDEFQEYMQSGETAADRLREGPPNKWPEDRHSPRANVSKGHKTFDQHNVEGPQERMQVVVTEGERRVRTSFNASCSTLVDSIKLKGADMIDFVDAFLMVNPEWNAATQNEFSRNKAVAITAIEKATMYAVKAATTQNS